MPYREYSFASIKILTFFASISFCSSFTHDTHLSLFDFMLKYLTYYPYVLKETKSASSDLS